MKTTYLRNTIMASLMITGLSLVSCKDKTETEAETTTETIETTEGASEAPFDTVVTDNDTVIESGTKNDTKENPVGTQVP